MKNSVMKIQNSERKHLPVDWNSLRLLLLLTVPTGIMAVLLLLWPDIRWVAEIPYTAIGIMGSFVALLLSVFIIARYREKPGIIYVSAGLMAMAIINGAQSVLPPGSSGSVWLHSLAGIIGGSFFVFYVLSKTPLFPIPLAKATTRQIGWLLGSVAITASLLGIPTVVFPDVLPVMVQDGRFSNMAWMVNTVPVVLFLLAGVSSFRQYRKTGDHELFLFTAILIFLFQASEVFYLASLWSVIWWLWLALRLAVYLAVLIYVLREYIQTSNSLAVEIDERKRIEEALRKADDDWNNSFNSLEEVMMIIDKDYNIENINNSGLALLSQNKEEVLGKKCYQVLHDKDKPGEYCPLPQTLGEKKVVSIERYDEVFGKHFSIKSAPILNENGEVIKYVYLISDITKHVEAEVKERLLQKELNLTSRLASIGEVAAGITHEINNPLTSVIAFAQILSQKDVPEDIREAVEVINDGANRIAGIVDKLLAFARRHKQDKEYVDINAIITSIVEMRSYEMRNNNIVVKTRLASDLPRTMANTGELQQVFLNIVINAEQAIAGAHHKTGEIFIKTKRVDNIIQISIADDGPGIHEDNIDKLFDPFFTTKDSDGGTGLGLSISYGIIKEHGGKIYAKSILGNGATFIIDLLIIAGTKQPEIAKPAAIVRESDKATRAKILVVDDELHICQALDRILSGAGHKVETIRVAQRALQRLNSSKYDLILLDIKMPGMDGIEFYNAVKEIEPSLQRKVICITGDIISARNKTFLNESRIPYIIKPFSVDELMQQVKLVIGGQTNNAQITYSYR